MNISSDFVSSQEVYQRLHDRVSYLLDWLQVDPDIGKFEQATSVEIEGYRHRLIHEFTRAKDIVDGAAHNA
ncbi:MAG: hypothetical protein R3D88_07325 [Alphaproteobacteria bacterium]|nr:hypothetical protein [Alphaproteobacteria bacterium]